MHPVLYQVNARCLLHELEGSLSRPVTFEDFEDERLEHWAASGFDFVWLLGVWQTGPIGRAMARSLTQLRAGYGPLVGGLRDEDMQSSPFAIQRYQVESELGGPAALASLRKRLRAHGIRLVLDFVPNHTAMDHDWVEEHPEWFVLGTEEDLVRQPLNYVRLSTRHGERVFAHGRDPNFEGWADTLQLNYASEGCRRAMIGELVRVAEQCDGVRCDMAMLLEPEVFARTWGRHAIPADGSEAVYRPFWREAIAEVRKQKPDFLFLAEVYWDMEWRLQQEGFDVTYDKRLFDRLRHAPARSVREHLCADMAFQARSLRFLENHDEPRAASSFPGAMHRAAAAVALLCPGVAFLHEGQTEGQTNHVPMQVRKRPAPPRSPEIVALYEGIVSCMHRPELRRGLWNLWSCHSAWGGNETWEQFIVFSWVLGERWLLVTVNYGPGRGQCYVPIGLPGLRGREFRLVDLLSDARYTREGDVLAGAGLYLELPGWGVHVFAVEPT